MGAGAHEAARRIEALLVFLWTRLLGLRTLVYVSTCPGFLGIARRAAFTVLWALAHTARTAGVTGLAGERAVVVEAVEALLAGRRLRRTLVHIDTGVFLLGPAELTFSTVLRAWASAGLTGLMTDCAHRVGVIPPGAEVAVHAVHAEGPGVAQVARALPIAAAAPISIAVTVSPAWLLSAPRTLKAVRSVGSRKAADPQGVHTEPPEEVRMSLLLFEPPVLEVLFLIFHHIVTLKSIALTQAFDDFYQANFTRLVFG